MMQLQPLPAIWKTSFTLLGCDVFVQGELMLRVTRIAIVVLIITSCAVKPAEDKTVGQDSAQYGIQLPVERDLPSLEGATDWINSKPLSREDLRGKVVLIDFWTYTCINWLRTQPYIRAWAEKYKDKGLVVI